MRYFILTLLFLHLIPCAEPDAGPVTPPAVVKILDVYDADVLKAQDAYCRAVEAAKSKATKALDREMSNATRKGDLDGAMIAKTKIELVTGHMPGGSTKIEFLGDAIREKAEADAITESIDLMEGKWACKSGLSGAMFDTEIKKGNWMFGKGFKVKVDIPNKNVVMSNSEHTITFPLPVTVPVWVGVHSGGGKYVLTKIAEDK